MKKNPQDATLRNTKASVTRDKKLSERVTRLEKFLNKTCPGWRKTL